jgi:hypothetical protein
MPVRPSLGNPIQQLQIHSFIDHPIKSQTGMGDIGLIGGLWQGLSSLGKVVRLNAAGEGMNTRMLVLLGFVEAMTTR